MKMDFLKRMQHVAEGRKSPKLSVSGPAEWSCIEAGMLGVGMKILLGVELVSSVYTVINKWVYITQLPLTIGKSDFAGQRSNA